MAILDTATETRSIRATRREGKWWLTMNAAKESLKNAPSYKYDAVKATWVPV